MSVTPDKLLYSALEVPVPDARGASYLDYWAQQAASDPDLTGADELQAIAEQGSAYLRVRDCRPPLSVIARWDAAVGSFNRMHADGAADMLRGAAVLLHINQRDPLDTFPIVRMKQPKDTTDAFLDVALQLGDLEAQEPSRALLIGGQLVHKAALIEPDADRQAALFDVAHSMYGRNYHADIPWTEAKIQAGQHLIDIDFHRLSQRIRRGCRAHEGHKAQRRQAAGLLRQQAGDLLRYEGMITRPEEVKAYSGGASELLATMAVRYMVYLNPDIKGNHPQIRFAFDSEDDAMHPRGTTRRRSFDLVHTRVTSNDQVIGARMLQMKSGNSMKKHPEEYHRAIDVIVVENLGIRTIFQIARGMDKVLASGQYQQPVSNLRVVSEPMQPYITPQKARVA